MRKLTRGAAALVLGSTLAATAAGQAPPPGAPPAPTTPPAPVTPGLPAPAGVAPASRAHFNSSPIAAATTSRSTARTASTDGPSVARISTKQPTNPGGLVSNTSR